MSRATGLTRRPTCFLVGLGLLFGSLASEAQTLPPEMPRNLISPPIPYQQGIANIEAQEAARPQATEPVLPSTDTRSSKIPTAPMSDQPTSAAPSRTKARR